MADDIVTRLRNFAFDYHGGHAMTFATCGEAADEIERLREQVDNLSKQLDQAVSRD